MIRTVLALLLLALSVFVFLSEVIGFYKFNYVMNRMHAAALGDTLGIASVAAAVAILIAKPGAVCKLVLIVVFMFFTGPAVTHLIAGAETEAHDGCGREYREEDRR
jgi:multicomponent Na+:H+ antiporter subunit G